MASAGSGTLIEYVAAAAVGVSAGVQAYSSVQQGQAQANVAKAKARQVQLDEMQKQIAMRQNMLRALASQNAGTLGAVGTGGASSFGANTRRQINQEQNDLLVSKANAAAQTSLLDQSAREDLRAGNMGAISAVVSDAAALVGA